MVKPNKNQTPYVRPTKINTIFENQNMMERVITANANNEPFTASNNERVAFGDCSHTQREHHKKEIVKRLNQSPVIQSLILYLSSISLCLGSIPILMKEKDQPYKQVTITMNNKSGLEIINCENLLLRKLVELKDKLSLSFKDYNIIRNEVCPHWPSEYFFKKAIDNLNKDILIGDIQRNRFGCYVDSKSKIIHYIKKNFKDMKIKDKIIRIKLVGDGTKTGPLTMLNFGFTLPDMGLIAKTATGNYQLGCFEIKKENYDTLKICLAEISKDLSNLAKFENNFIIDNETYTLKFLLGGDMKFLHTVMGLSACNSNHPCLWCKWHKDYFAKLSMDALPEILGLKRTTEEQERFLKKDNISLMESESVEGYAKTPIFDFINFDQCVFDTLHMLLRIVEKMMKLFLAELEVLDDNNSTNLKDLPYQNNFFESLRKIGVQNPIYYVNDVFKMKSLTGEDCLNILEKLKFDVFFPENKYPLFDKKEIFNSLLRGFNEMFLNVKNNFYAENIELLQNQTDEWLSSYTQTFHLKHVTGYLHLFCHHLCSFVEEHGDVDVFNCQGIEKRNHQLTREYFASNRKYNQKNFQYQMMSYRNRMESYKKHVPKPIIKRTNFKLKLVRNSIIKEETNQNWIECIYDGHLIKSSDTFANDSKTFSKKVLEAYIQIIKKDDTFIISNKIIENIVSDNITNDTIQMDNLSALTAILEKDNVIYLFYADLKTKMFYLINPLNLEQQNSFQLEFYENWAKFSRSNLHFTDKWKINSFKFNSKHKLITESDIPILTCFERLQCQQKQCKLDIHSFSMKRRLVLMKIEDYGKDKHLFCSSCGDDFILDNNAFRCQCRRKFHYHCMDQRYLINKLYKYESFHCFFCRRDCDKNIFRI